jgi:hypothetical protein
MGILTKASEASEFPAFMGLRPARPGMNPSLLREAQERWQGGRRLLGGRRLFAGYRRLFLRGDAIELVLLLVNFLLIRFR